MSQIDSDKQQYNVGYHEAQIKIMRKRTLETHGKFLKEYLKPGMKVLDCGCGPGTMTTGIAKAVFPGEVVAIDISEEQLELARTQAKLEKVSNIIFQVGSTYDLPASDNTFDLVFSQALLDHLQNPLDAILEQKRVTKIGGLVTAHSGNFSRKIIFPTNAVLEEAIKLRWQAITENGGDVDVGLKLGELFYKAKLSDICFSMFCDNRKTKDFANFFASEIFEFPYFQKLLASNRITLEKLKSFQQEWLDFAKIPYAYYGMLFGEAVGMKKE